MHWASNGHWFTLYNDKSDSQPTSHAQIQNVLSEGVQHLQRFFFLLCFLSWWGESRSKYHYKWAFICPPAKHHLNGVSLAGRCWPYIKCLFGSFVISQGSGPILLKNIYFLWFFRGGPDPLPSPPPSLDPRMLVFIRACAVTNANRKIWMRVLNDSPSPTELTDITLNQNNMG